jgi:hypothetical protein
MKNLIFTNFMLLGCIVLYAQQNPLPYFEEWFGKPNQYDDGVAYYIDNRIFVKSVSLQGNKTEAIFYERKNTNQYDKTGTVTLADADEYDGKYMILPLIQATYLRIEKNNQVKSIILPEKALYHAVSVTEKHIFVIGTVSKNAFFVCLDKGGNIQYEYTFNYAHANLIKSITEDKQGNLYCAGYMEQSINNTFDAWLAKLSPQKELLWSKLYGTEKGTDEFYRIQTTPHGLLCSGLTYRNDNFDTYILHTDMEGNFGSIGNPPSFSYTNKKLLNVPKNK